MYRDVVVCVLFVPAAVEARVAGGRVSNVQSAGDEPGGGVALNTVGWGRVGGLT